MNIFVKSKSLLYDLEQDDWALDVLGSLGLPNLLPPILPSGQMAGTLTTQAAQALGLKAGLPVATGGGDTPCAMLGNGVLEVGQAQLSVGTGAQIVVPQNQAVFQPTTHCYRTVLEYGAKYYAMSAMQNAGLALERVRGWLGLTWQDFHEAAFAVPDTAGLVFLPYLSGERTPLLNPQARGAFVNLGLQHNQTHLARAALEGVAWSLRDGLDALPERPQALRVVGGGLLEPRWRQLLSDVLQVPLYSSGTTNASARGAALLAGCAVGVYQDLQQTVAHLPSPQQIASPEQDLAASREHFRAVQQHLLELSG